MQAKNDKYEAILKCALKFCFDREDPVRAIRNMRNFNEGYDAFGIEDEEIKVLRDRILDEFDLEVDELADLGSALLKTGKYELGTLAIMMLKKNRPRLTAHIRDQVKYWLDELVENWAHADFLAIKILPVLFELDLMDLEVWKQWRDSESKWTRRASFVTFVWLRKAEKAENILEFIKPCLNENDRNAQMGLSWLITDLWHKSSEQVEEYLLEHKKDINPYILKAVSDKMPHAKAKAFRPKIVKNRNNQNRNNQNRQHKARQPRKQSYRSRNSD